MASPVVLITIVTFCYLQGSYASERNVKQVENCQLPEVEGPFDLSQLTVKGDKLSGSFKVLKTITDGISGSATILGTDENGGVAFFNVPQDVSCEDYNTDKFVLALVFEAAGITGCPEAGTYEVSSAGVNIPENVGKDAEVNLSLYPPGMPEDETCYSLTTAS